MSSRFLNRITNKNWKCAMLLPQKNNMEQGLLSFGSAQEPLYLQYDERIYIYAEMC